MNNLKMVGLILLVILFFVLQVGFFAAALTCIYTLVVVILGLKDYIILNGWVGMSFLIMVVGGIQLEFMEKWKLYKDLKDWYGK